MSAFAIAWSVVLLIFFNFFNQYIAFYQQVPSGSGTSWQISPIITSDFYLWLPVVTVTLILSIVGYAILIAFDKYVLRQLVRTVLDVLGVVTVVSLLVIFPFNFNVIPNADIAFWTSFGLTSALIVVAVGMGVGALVRLIKLIVHVAEGKY